MKRYGRKVYYYELDKMGIMHHSNYIRIMEEARLDLLIQLGVDYFELEKKGYVSPVTKVRCDYISMIDGQSNILVEITITRYTGIIIEMSYKIYDGLTGIEYATAKSQHCFVKKETNKIVEIRNFSQDMDERIRTFMEKRYGDK